MDPEIQTGSTDAGARRHDYQTQQGPAGKATRIRDDLANLKNDLDALMSHASTLSEAELHEARDRMLARFASVRFSARGIAEQAGKQFNQGRDITVDYVRDKPLQSVAIAAGVGMLVGAMLRRD